MAAKKDEKKDAAGGKDATPSSSKKDEAPAAPPAPRHPPVEAAARRLERLLGGGQPGDGRAASPATTASTSHAQPSRTLKKWLGSCSGAAGKATLAGVAACAERVLDPAGPCATGRDLLVALAGEGEREAVRTEFEASLKKDDEESGGETTTAMDEDKKDDGNDKKKEDGYLSKSAREVESWLLSLAVRIRWRSGDVDGAYDLVGKALSVIDAHVSDLGSNPSLSAGGLYPLLSRLVRYRSLVVSSSDPARRSALAAGHRDDLALRHRSAVLRRDPETAATVLNVMLSDLLAGDEVEQAQKLLSNASFPAESAGNNQLVRYLYHSGRVQALRLEYTQSYSNLSQALRKSPTNAGLGFRIAVQRLLVVVQLLMGEVPDRSVFFGKGMVSELRPYLEIAQAVRRGDLAVFHSTVASHADRLRDDRTYTLISRLAHSVVKAGLRRLKTSYSRISLDDVASRLGLPSSASAEFVVAKAVRDGVIDATIDRDGGYVRSHDLTDVYATVEPSEAFHRRIAFCLTTHNDAVRAMRYTPDAYKRQLEASRGMGRRGRDDKTDEEKAKEIEDEMEEDYDDY